jgi:prepilin-type N-terminal cleavage/methylation domain-containing protein
MGHHKIQPNRAAFTLLETLASLAILGVFIAMAGGWLTSSVATTRSLTAGATANTVAARALTALRDDLDAADPRTIVVERAALAMRTAHALPGQPAGWSQVRWELDERSGVLQRRSDARTEPTATGSTLAARPIAVGVAEFHAEWVAPEPTATADTESARTSSPIGAQGRSVLVALRIDPASDPRELFWSADP